MVKQSSTRQSWLRLSLAICVAVLGVTSLRAQHAFEFAARAGANALLYDTDYGKPMPNYNVGVDFSYKYRSPFFIGARVGLGVDVAAGTYVAGKPGSTDQVIGTPPSDEGASFDPYRHFPIMSGGAYSDYYVMPRSYEPDAMIANVGYSLDRFTETQQLIIASAPVQLGVFIGDFSLFAGVRVSVPVHGMYWQRIRNSNLKVYYPQGVTFPDDAGNIDPTTDEAGTSIPYDPKTATGIVPNAVNGIRPLANERYDRFKPHFAVMVDLNYSFKVGDKTDVAIGAYLEYDPMAYTMQPTNNTSLMEWHYSRDIHTNDPVFRRDYVSVLEANRAAGGVMLGEGEVGETQLVRKYNRASVGIRISVSLWSVPLDFGNMYRKQQRFNVCHCDFDN